MGTGGASSSRSRVVYFHISVNHQSSLVKFFNRLKLLLLAEVAVGIKRSGMQLCRYSLMAINNSYTRNIYHVIPTPSRRTFGKRKTFLVLINKYHSNTSNDPQDKLAFKTQWDITTENNTLGLRNRCQLKCVPYFSSPSN